MADTPIPAKVYRYAQRLVERWDRDSDQSLDRHEWGMQWGFVTSDADFDGRVSLEELVRRIARYGRHRRIRLIPPLVEGEEVVSSLLNPVEEETDAVASDAAEANSAFNEPPDGDAVEASESARDTKYVSNPERRPQGLPSWFFARDADGDGQLSMAEFAPKPTSATLAEFARYDRDGDGVITPDEYLRTVKSPADADNEPR